MISVDNLWLPLCWFCLWWCLIGYKSWSVQRQVVVVTDSVCGSVCLFMAVAVKMYGSVRGADLMHLLWWFVVSDVSLWQRPVDCSDFFSQLFMMTSSVSVGLILADWL